MITDFFGSAAKKGAKGKRKLSSTSNLSTTGSASKRLKSSSSAGSASSSMSPLINDEKENGKSGAVGASASGSGAGGAAASPLFNAGDLGDAGWIKAIGREFDRGYFKAIEKELRANELKRIKVYPPREQIFNAFRFCPFEGMSFLESTLEEPFPALRQPADLPASAFLTAASRRSCRDRGPRPVPWPRTSSWALLLRPRRRCAASISAQHDQGSKGLLRLERGVER